MTILKKPKKFIPRQFKMKNKERMKSKDSKKSMKDKSRRKRDREKLLEKPKKRLMSLENLKRRFLLGLFKREK